MSSESIVRPYQSPDLSPGKVIIDTGYNQQNNPVHLQLGKGGYPPKTFTAHFSSNTSTYLIHKPKETQSS